MTIGERLAAKLVRARKFGFPITEEIIEERRAIAAQEQDVLRAHRDSPGGVSRMSVRELSALPYRVNRPDHKSVIPEIPPGEGHGCTNPRLIA